MMCFIDDAHNRKAQEEFEEEMGNLFIYDKTEFGLYRNLLTTACFAGFVRGRMYEQMKNTKITLEKVKAHIEKSKGENHE